VTRRVRPARRGRARYPRLAGAWRIVVGAAPLALSPPAHGDASLPEPKAPIAHRHGALRTPVPPLAPPDRSWLLDDGPVTHAPREAPPERVDRRPLVLKMSGVMASPAPPAPLRLVLGRARVDGEPAGDPSAGGLLEFVDETLGLDDGVATSTKVKLEPAPVAPHRTK
jgi:hypothetical protein